jgi:hypothetical protein
MMRCLCAPSVKLAAPDGGQPDAPPGAGADGQAGAAALGGDAAGAHRPRGSLLSAQPQRMELSSASLCGGSSFASLARMSEGGESAGGSSSSSTLSSATDVGSRGVGGSSVDGGGASECSTLPLAASPISGSSGDALLAALGMTLQPQESPVSLWRRQRRQRQQQAQQQPLQPHSPPQPPPKPQKQPLADAVRAAAASEAALPRSWSMPGWAMSAAAAAAAGGSGSDSGSDAGAGARAGTAAMRATKRVRSEATLAAAAGRAAAHPALAAFASGGLGVAFSGGGFRFTYFLGVMDVLVHELGCVTATAPLSGGSRARVVGGERRQ